MIADTTGGTVHVSSFPSAEIPEGSVTDFALRHVSRLGSKRAITDASSGLGYSYDELQEGARALSSGLSQWGLGHGSVVAVLAPNLVEYPLIFHGVAMGGRTLTTLNPLYTVWEIREQVKASGASMLFTVPSLVDKAKAAALLTSVRGVVVIGESEGAEDVIPWSSLMGDANSGDAPVDQFNDVVALPYSSGTTGLPKGVMLTHRNLLANLVAIESVVPLREDDVVLAVLPFFHIYGLNVIMNPALAAGATMVVMQRFDVESYLKTIETYGVTVLFAAPPMVLALAQHPTVNAFNLSSVRWLMSSAAPLDATTARAAQEKLGCTVFQAYGMTEASPGVFSNRPEDPGPMGSVGLLVPGLECRIVDPGSGDDLGINMDGEILIRGEQIMKGYLDNEESTSASIDELGYYHSGDIGRVDEEGRWFIVDRVKELIKYKGYQVAPAELEAVLLSHPNVADAAVVGVPAGDDGEFPKAFVVCPSPVESQTLMDFVSAQVAPYKRIRAVEYIAEIPRSATGKILRRVLRDRDSSVSGALPADL
jgi:acyl-CoA synthetase (AMP-forming)/AMP-acid ligase II